MKKKENRKKSSGRPKRPDWWVTRDDPISRDVEEDEVQT